MLSETHMSFWCYGWYKFEGLKHRIKLYKTRATRKTMEGERFATQVLQTKQLNVMKDINHRG